MMQPYTIKASGFIKNSVNEKSYAWVHHCLEVCDDEYLR